MKLHRILTCCALFLVCCGSLKAQFEKPFLAADLVLISVFGGFNGEDALAGTSDVFLLPRLQASPGVGISLGATFTKTKEMLAVRYEAASLKAEFEGDGLGKATYQLIGLEVRKLIAKPLISTKEGLPALQFQFGACPGIVFLRIPDGHRTLSTIKADSRFTAASLQALAGLVYHVLPQVDLQLQASYRMALLLDAKKISGGTTPLEVDGNVGMGGPILGVGFKLVI